jgi:two-component sensor histidine kinase
MITVELLQEFKERLKLSVSDNGIGFPSDLDFKNIDSLGMMIINTLTKQIEGEIKLDRRNGTKFTVTFKDKDY